MFVHETVSYRLDKLGNSCSFENGLFLVNKSLVISTGVLKGGLYRLNLNDYVSFQMNLIMICLGTCYGIDVRSCFVG